STHGLWKYCSVVSQRWHLRTGRPYIVHPEGMLDSWALRNAMWKKRIAALLYEDRHLRDAPCLRALCEAEAQSIRSYGMRNPICVIPNGIDLPELVESSTLETESPVFRTFAQGRKILLYLGRLHPKKNVANLIRVWKQTLNSHPSAREDWALAIAGWDQAGYERELKTLTSDYGLMAGVQIFGSFVRPGERCSVSRLRRIRSAVIERRAANDGAGSVGVCETGVDDTGV